MKKIIRFLLKKTAVYSKKRLLKHNPPPPDPELNESIESKVDHVLKGERHKKVDPVSLKKNSGFIEEKKALNDIYAFLDGKKYEQVYAITKKT